MTDKQITQLLGGLATLLLTHTHGKGSFIYGRPHDANFYSNRADLPMVQLLPLEYSDNLDQGNTDIEVALLFIGKVPARADHMDEAQVVCEMGEVAKIYTKLLHNWKNEGASFFEISAVRRRPMFEMYVSKLYGYEVILKMSSVIDCMQDKIEEAISLLETLELPVYVKP